MKIASMEMNGGQRMATRKTAKNTAEPLFIAGTIFNDGGGMVYVESEQRFISLNDARDAAAEQCGAGESPIVLKIVSVGRVPGVQWEDK